MYKNYPYSASDKALFDALNQSKIPLSELREYFLSKGVIVSSQTSREELAKNLSRYIHDYYDHQKIASKLGVSNRKERNTAKFLPNDITTQQVENAARLLIQQINKEGDLCQLYKNKDGSFVLDATYEVLDFKKGEFSQVVKKNAKVKIEFSDSGVVVRRPDNEFTQKWEESLLINIENEIGRELVDEVEQIHLSNISDPKVRTEFFVQLISSIGNYEVYDVSDVHIYHPEPENVDIELELDCDETYDKNSVHIRRASLAGQGVLESEELNALYEKDFYIWKIRWRLKKKSDSQSNIYTFEAQFNNPEDCLDFSYSSKGMRKYKGNSEHNKTSVPLASEEELMFNQLIEDCARNLSRDLIEQALGDVKDDTSSNQVA